MATVIEVPGLSLAMQKRLERDKQEKLIQEREIQPSRTTASASRELYGNETGRIEDVNHQGAFDVYREKPTTYDREKRKPIPREHGARCGLLN